MVRRLPLSLLLLLRLLPPARVAGYCDIGASFEYGVCSCCYQGKYASMINSQACLFCPPGTYVDNYCRSTCVSCAAGKYATGSGATVSSVCTACGPGTIAPPPPASGCTACYAGTYSPSAGLTVCTPCGSNTFTAARGAQSCTPCSTSCPPGTSGGTLGVCTATSDAVTGCTGHCAPSVLGTYDERGLSSPTDFDYVTPGTWYYYVWLFANHSMV